MQEQLDPIAACAPPLDALPQEVQMILTAIDSGQHPGWERRARNRASYYTEAKLRLFSDLGTGRHRVLYTRDVSTRGLGFITPDQLPLGHGGRLTLTGPHGRRMQIQCTLSRCRQISVGWYEGALQFVREQMDFADITG
jgi:hypothetical protein